MTFFDTVTHHQKEAKPIWLFESDPNVTVEHLPFVDLARMDHSVFELVEVRRVLKSTGIHSLGYEGGWGKARSMPYATHLTVFRFERRDPDECYICTWEGCKACRLTHQCECRCKEQS